MREKIENNVVVITGEVASAFSFSHEVLGEKFYEFNVKVKRLSGSEDLIPVVVSERLLDVSEDLTGVPVKVSGQFRSHNLHDGKSRLILHVFTRELEFLNDCEDGINHISLEGFVCKPPTYRETPLGREISDVLIAVNRPYRKSDYIPCICWGRNARFVSGVGVGSKIKVQGRIQSRKYSKKISETEYEDRVAYEVSVSSVSIIEG